MDPKKTGARENRVCVTTGSGNTIWIPESRLEAWEKADHDAPLTDKELELINQMKERIYGGSISAIGSEPLKQSAPIQNDSPSYLSPRIFVHDPHGGGHWEEYTPGEDRAPNPPEPPSFRHRTSPRSSSDSSTSSIREELRYTKRCLGSARSELNELSKKLTSYQAQIKGLKINIRLIIIVSIVLSILLCNIVSSSVSSKYKRLIDEAYSDGESVGYDAGYDDGYQDGRKSKLGSFSYNNSTASTSSGNTGETRDTAIAYSYIGNKRTKKYHYPFCSYLPDNNNQIVFSSAEDAEAQGYDPCLRCNPW